MSTTATFATAPPGCSLRSRSPPGRSPPTRGGVMFRHGERAKRVADPFTDE